MISQLFFMLAASSIFISYSSGSPFYKHENRGLCGSRLVDTLAIVCNYHYNSPVNKKSVKWNLEEASDYSDDYNTNALTAPGYHWLDNDLNLFIPVRHQRGIVEECCKKPCSLSELKSYCSAVL
ncbi:insulin-like [Harmonia axyridis]|uniref:insulin-like n=1 Tax=Harmonia axyridis TaxID=115357 RepID=UPI001E276D96|nr:insulin-like [Harmonia axyridis]